LACLFLAVAFLVIAGMSLPSTQQPKINLQTLLHHNIIHTHTHLQLWIYRWHPPTLRHKKTNWITKIYRIMELGSAPQSFDHNMFTTYGSDTI
jgi:hypothetical protein